MKLRSIILIFCFTVQLSHQTISKNVEPVLRISSGLISGTSVDFRGVKVYQFLGIPFAEPPLNRLRFQKPVPKKPWKGVLSANEWGSACMQPVYPGLNSGLRLSEDCLVLNVFTTEAAFKDQRNIFENELRPVMVWIHGGYFSYGSGNLYDGTPITAIKDVIVVTVNYRLGPLGFLYLPEAGAPGNMGLWDQQLALKWVKDNIEQFGGDPDAVTIFGESAGSTSVSAQLVSPQSKGLFKNVIMQSGSIYDINLLRVPNIAQNFFHEINCTSNNYKLCLSNYQFGQFTEADGLAFRPIVGDEFLPDHPEEIISNYGVDPSINVLLGTVGNEGIFLILAKDYNTFNPSNPVNLTIPNAKHIFGKLFGEKLIDFYSDHYLASIKANDFNAIRLAIAQAVGDAVISCPAYSFGRDLVSKNVPNVYAYVQLQKPSQSLVEQATWTTNIATHTDDISMIFARPLIKPDSYNVEDAVLSLFMLDIWTGFAKDGKPPQISYKEWTAWSNYNKKPYYAMVLDSKKFGLVERRHVDFCLKNWPFPIVKPLDLSPENLTMQS